MKRVVEKELKPFRESSDETLNNKDFSKITDYYALGVPAIIGSSFCVLRKQSMRPHERVALSFLGGISGLLDDLFDDENKKPGSLEEFILQPEKMTPSNSHESLLKRLYLGGLSASANPGLLKQQAIKVYEAQKKSHSQRNADISKQEIEDVTIAKGGTAFVFYRLCLDHRLQEAEEKLVYHMGGLMQLGNDIFDVYEDQNAGINTIATTCTDVSYLKDIFHNGLQELFRLAAETSYTDGRKRRFLKISALALARVCVCLNQFEKLQRSTGNVFSPEKYSRKQLICDMQKPSNQIRSVKYYMKIAGPGKL